MNSNKKYNNLDFSNIPAIINYLTNHTYPPNIDTQAKQKRYSKQYDDFEVIDGDKLYLANRWVVPNTDKDNDFVDAVLEHVYNDPRKGLVGQTLFYKYINKHYLNITKKQCIDYLKAKTEYQLTRQYVKEKVTTKQYKQLNAGWAIDLIDVSNVAKQNKHYNFIFTVIDQFTKKVWYRPLKHKTVEDCTAILKEIFKTEKPKVIISDMGTEFNFDEFLKENAVKHIRSQSYTPVPQIENANNQLRKMIRELNVKNGNLNWEKYLPDLEYNKNNQYNGTTGHSANDIVDNKDNIRNVLHDNIVDDVKNAVPKYSSGDFVRIKLSALDSAIRKMYKANLQKLVPVKFTPEIYIISKIFTTKNNKLGLSYYSLKTEDGDILKNSDNTITRFKQGDLLKVPADTDRDFHITWDNVQDLNTLAYRKFENVK